jgi:hypothetical protein
MRRQSARGELGVAALVAALVLVFGLGRGWFRNSARPVVPADAPMPVLKLHSARTNKSAFLSSRPRQARTNAPAPATISFTETNQIANWEEATRTLPPARDWRALPVSSNFAKRLECGAFTAALRVQQRT